MLYSLLVRLIKIFMNDFYQLRQRLRQRIIVTVFVCLGCGVTVFGLFSVQGADTNNNGMSDIYERIYGLPMSALGDEDGDGYSNLAEYLMGGNPRLNGDLSHFLISTTSSANFPVLSWRGAWGMRYQAQHSTELNSWVNDGVIYTAAGTTETHTLTDAVSSFPKYFWRVQALGSVDRDGDGLNAWEEFALNTDPNLPDSDGDGVMDGLDFYPLDPSRSQPLAATLGDVTAPSINIVQPTPTTLVP